MKLTAPTNSDGLSVSGYRNSNFCAYNLDNDFNVIGERKIIDSTSDLSDLNGLVNCLQYGKQYRIDWTYGYRGPGDKVKARWGIIDENANVVSKVHEYILTDGREYIEPLYSKLSENIVLGIISDSIGSKYAVCRNISELFDGVTDVAPKSESCNKTISIYANKKHGCINALIQMPAAGTVTLYDLQGRSLVRKIVLQDEIVNIIRENVKTGLYLLCRQDIKGKVVAYRKIVAF